ncbi:hypothetical protein BC835DRAFT_1423322 [Cytidiella melzeri]|nr:hypothetical protein BC835DRAFT_1423322 [Cytidiella melzeri]
MSSSLFPHSYSSPPFALITYKTSSPSASMDFIPFVPTLKPPLSRLATTRSTSRRTQKAFSTLPFADEDLPEGLNNTTTPPNIDQPSDSLDGSGYVLVQPSDGHTGQSLFTDLINTDSSVPFPPNPPPTREPSPPSSHGRTPTPPTSPSPPSTPSSPST